MKKITLLSIAIAVLLVLNIVTLGFIMLRNNEPEPPEFPEMEMKLPREVIAEALHFDEQQQKQYDEVIAQHQNKIERLDKQIRRTKHRLFAQLSVENNTKKDSLLIVLSKYHNEVELLHYQHFMDIKAICNNDQIDDFDELVHELPRIFRPRGGMQLKERPPHRKPMHH